MRTPFKQRSSPVKGKLQNFFNSVGENLQRNKRDIGADLKEKYNRTKESTPKAGESQYQADVRTRKARSKKADKYVTKTPEQQGKIDPKSEVKIDPRVGMDRYTYTDAGDSKPKSAKTKKEARVVKKQTDLTKVKGSTTYVDPNEGKVVGKKKADGTLNLDPVLDLNKKTKSKKYKAPKKKANIFSSGLDLTGKYLNKLDRAFGFKTVPKFMRKYDN